MCLLLLGITVANTAMIWFVGTAVNQLTNSAFEALVTTLAWLALIVVLNQGMQFAYFYTFEWVYLRFVARIRKARLLLDQGRGDAGLAILAQVDTSAFAASVEELRGDILMASRDAKDAASAYEAALASTSITPAMRARVQMKRDDLGYDESAGVAQ